MLNSHPNINFYKVGSGIKSWLFTLDHKRIGLMYLLFICISFGIGGTFALLLRLELLTPGTLFFTAKEYNQLFTLHGAVMVLFPLFRLRYEIFYFRYN
jgi:cytochrome c oxidase subunit 1